MADEHRPRPQSIYLSDTSIAENIAFGVPLDEIDLAQVAHAAGLARIAEFVETLPQAYLTPVGERGARLSGGQRQRIGIARALYKRPTLLVLDEATSALDSETEAEVMRAIDAIGGELTVLMVAHRVSTLGSCSQIYRMIEGPAARDREAGGVSAERAALDVDPVSGHRRQYVTLDGLRGAAAILVMLCHFGLDTVQYVPRGDLAVNFFFVLSGFVLAKAYDARLRGGLPFASFATARFLRFYPLYLLGTLFGAAFQLVLILYHSPRALGAETYAATFAAGLLMLPPPVPAHFLYPFNIPAWSLLFELLINFLFAPCSGGCDRAASRSSCWCRESRWSP